MRHDVADREQRIRTMGRGQRCDGKVLLSSLGVSGERATIWSSISWTERLPTERTGGLKEGRIAQGDEVFKPRQTQICMFCSE